MANICILGASLSWAPTLVTDLITVFDEPLEIRLVDIDPAAAQKCAEWGAAANKHHSRKDKYICCPDRRSGLTGADAVIITLATGGLAAMEHDLLIPEKYGIYATVGDTAGVGGWSRALRNIPTFMEFAQDFQQICPNAFIANYTNPLSALTATLQLSCDNPSVGLCHAYFAMQDVIQKIFGLPDWSKIAISVAGMNHFTWAVDFTIDGRDGYRLLRQKVGDRSLADVMPDESADEIGMASRHEFCVQLYDAFGYLPYPADRHTVEFVSYVICGPGQGPPQHKITKDGQPHDAFDYCNVARTSIENRNTKMRERQQRIDGWISGSEPMCEPSRETGANMIRAYLENTPFIDAVNCLNVGQIAGLPLGACVETLGCIDGMGVRPLMVDHVPEHLLELMRTHALCQKWTVEGAMNRDKNLLLQALYNDRQCAHMQLGQVRQMADDLFAANKQWFSC